MSVVRRFLVAPSLVRLIRKERGNARITEGYFAPQAGRTSFVRVDGQSCHLVLVTTGADGTSSEERTDVPRAHGDALLDVCSGKAVYERTALSTGGREVLIDRYVTPAALDLVSVAFEADGEASGFAPPLWFGREVTSEGAYDRHAIALQGAPAAGEIGLTNAALDAVLDLIEPRFGLGRYGGAPRPAADDGVVNALRRMSAPTPPPTPPAPAPVEPPEPEVLPEVKAAEPAPLPKAPEPAPAAPTDARMDDVFESLSQALGAAIQPPPPAPAAEAPQDDPGAAFERWTVRPRRSNIQPT
ncbi:hypothetical protein [Methylobacterium sp. sgz302541]|uniref:hypothetical protein n=1 Tax=unclassified Methylobacterium TaxID=2615210 RepID=UPI003D3409A7